MARLIFGLYWILGRKQFIKYIRYTQYIKFMKYIYQFKYIYTKYIEWLDWSFADIGKQLIKYIPHWHVCYLHTIIREVRTTMV